MVMRFRRLTNVPLCRQLQSCWRTFAVRLLTAILIGGCLLNPAFGFVLPAAAQSDTGDTDTEETIYVVRPGDTLFAIAQHYDVSLRALMERNGLSNANFIYVGQRLTIPNAPRVTPSPTVEEEATTEAKPTTEATATVAPQPTATAVPQPTPVQVLTTVYTVQAGDTLSAIARRFETTVSDLLRRNGMGNADYVYVGQRLEVPVPVRDEATDDERGTEANPIRINFAAGATAASVEGVLTFPQRTCYVLEALAGQEINITIASGGDLANFLVRAADSAVNNGVPLKRLENEDRTWSHVLPVSGDYIVCVAVPEGAAAYVLTVSIPAGCTSVTQEIEVVDWAAVIASDPRLDHEVIGEDNYVSVAAATTTVAGIPQLDQIVYGDFDGDCLEEAGIPLFSGGTAGNVGFLVFDIVDENVTTGATPTLVAWGEGYKLLLLADAGLLIVSNALYSGWEANCCPSGVSYDGYRLQEGALTLVSAGSEGYPEMRVATVEHFYTLLQNGNFTEAYALLSPIFQEANPFDAWQAGYANTQSFVATVSADTAVANRVVVDLEVNERLNNGTTRIRHYRGHWDLAWNGEAPGWILQDGSFVVVP
ncbi:MAG: LysM peptidoglycan-binding domain-containing protein [Caldilineaceae bacterium]|nr:LysM peptidoglycan-binding domain-containing protein [Caldilineaceae bacterium]